MQEQENQEKVNLLQEQINIYKESNQLLSFNNSVYKQKLNLLQNNTSKSPKHLLWDIEKAQNAKRLDFQDLAILN